MLISNEKLKALISDLDLLPVEQLNLLFKEAKDKKLDLGELLIEKDLISDDKLGRVIARYLGCEFISLKSEAISGQVLNLVPEVVARKQKVIAFAQGPDGIKLAMFNPKNLEIIIQLEKKIGQPIIPYLTTERNINEALVFYRQGIQKEFSEIIKESINQAQKSAKPQDLPIIRIVDSIILYAYDNKSSDIHIEPQEKLTLVRFRIDGVLHDIINLPKEIHDLIITRLKIMAKLRTDEHAAAQDGKIRFNVSEVEQKNFSQIKEKLDIRISIVPMTEGEKAVMRLLSERSRQFSLQTLGLTESDLTKLKKEIAKPYGMILATGPTGGGKTTTMYAILKILNQREVNISTIEDPVEYDMEGVNQTQVNPKTNLTFANGLRSILRQDPDIIMVGEIRDEETAGIAINSAMTGHLVLSTFHTNDAPTTLPRFLDMGIEPFLIASTVNIIIAQRLVRKICSKCITTKTINFSDLEKHFSSELLEKVFGKNQKALRVYYGKGCPVCSQTGYKGRVGIFEVLSVSEEIQKLIMSRADANQIREQAVKEGMRTMIEDGLTKVIAGLTTLEEVVRATRE